MPWGKVFPFLHVKQAAWSFHWAPLSVLSPRRSSSGSASLVDLLIVETHRCSLSISYLLYLSSSFPCLQSHSNLGNSLVKAVSGTKHQPPSLDRQSWDAAQQHCDSAPAIVHPEQCQVPWRCVFRLKSPLETIIHRARRGAFYTLLLP